ncbi:MAG: hypothetical protein KY464_09790 [Gemmatimonadetes bacterium]|nr:hypothetical protein [Gemmatimonadota bacterium]
MTKTHKLITPYVAVFLALAGCEATPTGLEDSENAGGSVPPESAEQGAIVGRLDSGIAASSSAFDLPSFTLLQGAGITVAAARVKTDGALETLASASAAADGSYRIEKVPAGLDRLVVVATSGADEVGRVIVHQAVAKNGSVTAAPITGGTSVEARVFGELVRSGMPKEAINTVELAQSIATSGKTTADALVRSSSDLKALADGFKARQEAYTRVLAARGVSLDVNARFEASLPAVVAYALERHAGAQEKAAEAKVSAAMAEAFRGKGVDRKTQAEASGAAETALLRAANVANSSARLDIARAAHSVNLRARERQTAEILAALGAPASQQDAAREAFAGALRTVEGATSEDAMAEAVAQAAARVEAAFEAHALQNSRIPQVARDRIKAAMQNLPSASDLSARLGNARSGNDVASAYLVYVNDLRSAVQTAVSLAMGAGVSMDGKGVADLFTGLRASVQTR